MAVQVTGEDAVRGGCGFAAPMVLRWHVIHTKSRQEKALAEFLAGRAVEHFLPLVRTVRYYGRRKFTVSLPLFPGYLFMRGTREDWFLAERTDRVARVIPVADQFRLEADLSQVRLALELGAPLRPAPWLAEGMRVEVIAGPFKGIRGLVDRAAAEDRLVLRVELLGRVADLEIDRSLLQPAD